MKLVFFAIGPTALMFFGHFALPNQFRDTKAPGEFLQHNQYRVSCDTILVSDNYLASAVCWSYKRTDVLVLGRTGELTYGFGYDDSKHRLLEVNGFKELITKSSGKGSIVLIFDTERYAEYSPLLPKPVFKDVKGDFVFAEFARSDSTEGALLPAENAQN